MEGVEAWTGSDRQHGAWMTHGGTHARGDKSSWRACDVRPRHLDELVSRAVPGQRPCRYLSLLGCQEDPCCVPSGQVPGSSRRAIPKVP